MTEFKYSAPQSKMIMKKSATSFKCHLNINAEDVLLTFEELRILAHIKLCLNSRPIVASSDDPIDHGSDRHYSRASTDH